MKGLSEDLQQILANRLRMAGLAEYFSDIAVDLEGVPVKAWENASAVGTIVSLARAAKANEAERFNLERKVKELRDENKKLQQDTYERDDEVADLALENERLKEDLNSAESELQEAYQSELKQELLADLYRKLFEEQAIEEDLTKGVDA